MTHERENDHDKECEHNKKYTMHTTADVTGIASALMDKSVNHTVVKSYQAYCDSTPWSQISLQGYMHYFPEKSCSRTILGEWTGSVLPYLKRHSNQRKKNVGHSFSRVQHSDLLNIIHEELRMRDHLHKMLPDVSQQQQIVGTLNTARLGRYASGELESARIVPGLPLVSPFTDAKHKDFEANDTYQVSEKPRKKAGVGLSVSSPRRTVSESHAPTLDDDCVETTLPGRKHPRQDKDLSLQSSQSFSKQSRRVSFGQTAAKGDPVSGVLSKISENFDGSEGDRRSSFGSSLLSTDPDDASYVSSQDQYQPTAKLYTWDYLVGNGRVDSRVENLWVINGEKVGRDLMEFRDRVVLENGGLTDPHEKLAVNFIFLIESFHQKMGLNSEVENRSWTVLCEATKIPMCSLDGGVLLETHRWIDILGQESQEAIWELLKISPPTDPNLKSILDSIKNSGQLWDGRSSNEDTYLKSLLGPFLATYLSELAYVTYNWTQAQNETRDEDSSLLIPDFSAVTSAQKRELSLLLLEGKVTSNKGFQIWDDRTKLGQEMKLALDSILKLLPKDDVCVIGILVKEPLVEFFSMTVLSEGVYIMRRFAVCHISSDIMNMTSIIPMMKAFQHVREKVKKTVDAIQSVKVRPSESPCVPLSWLRPSFRKPKMKLILDNE